MLNENTLKKVYETITSDIERCMKNMPFFQGIIIGLSGGIDSAIVAALAAKKIDREKILGVLMPSEFSTNHSIDDAILLAKNLKIKIITVPIKNMYLSFRETLFDSVKKSELDEGFKNKIELFDTSYENLQARIRGTTLMTLSNKYNLMLLNTGNRSEFSMGYATLHGDMCGVLSPIGELYKTEVFKLARYINKIEGNIIPENSIVKPPSAELRENQKDSDSLPDYEILDKILKLYLDKKLSEETIIKTEDETTVKKIIKTYKANSFKRRLAPEIISIRKIIDFENH